MNAPIIHRPSPAFIAASWVALLLGAVAYLVGLFNAEMPLNEKGYYLTLLLFGCSRRYRCRRVCATASRAFR